MLLIVTKMEKKTLLFFTEFFISKKNLKKLRVCMKQKKFQILSFVVVIFNNICASDTQPLPAITTPTSFNMLMSLDADPEMTKRIEKLNNTVVPYPIRGTVNGQITQGITNRGNKAMPPLGTQPILSNGRFSVLPAKKNEFKDYPGGELLFPGYPELSGQFDAMIKNMQANRQFIHFFRKVHINALHQLYHYLMSIYVNFNLQHTGIDQSNSGTLSVNIPLFLEYEKEYASNKKTLIINHLINIIESQFNGSIRSYVPNIPQVYASYAGKVLVQNDYCMDLTELLTEQTKSVMIERKNAYLKALADYLTFFQNYTGYLLKPHPTQKTHFTAFVDIAEQINQFLYADADPAADKNLIAVQKMNPPLFNFTYDDMRALKIIPYLAKSLPAKSKRIMWPEQIKEAANKGLVLNIPGQTPHPIAYFRTKDGIAVKNMNSNLNSKLYVCMRSGVNLFEEELIAEPDWLSSWEGIVNIMRACYGDFSALLGLNILDPCMESLVNVVVAVQQGKSAPVCSDACQALINKWKQKKSTSTEPSIENVIPGLPTISTQLPETNFPPPNDIPNSTSTQTLAPPPSTNSSAVSSPLMQPPG